LFWIDVEYILLKFTKLKICLSGKDIFLLHKHKSVEQKLDINLIIMYGKYHIHKQKWTNKPNIILLKIELKHYIEALKDARNKKAKWMYTIFESLSFWIFFVMIFPL